MIKQRECFLTVLEAIAARHEFRQFTKLKRGRHTVTSPYRYANMLIEYGALTGYIITKVGKVFEITPDGEALLDLLRKGILEDKNHWQEFQVLVWAFLTSDPRKHGRRDGELELLDRYFNPGDDSVYMRVTIERILLDYGSPQASQVVRFAMEHPQLARVVQSTFSDTDYVRSTVFQFELIPEERAIFERIRQYMQQHTVRHVTKKDVIMAAAMIWSVAEDI